MKLNPNELYGEFYWVAHPNAHPTDEVAKMLIKRRYELEVIGGISDEEASYEYDDFALVVLDNQYYLLETSGCSCTDPAETWGIGIGPASLDEIAAFIRGGHYSGYTLPKKKEADLLALIEEARNAL